MDELLPQNYFDLISVSLIQKTTAKSNHSNLPTDRFNKHWNYNPRWIG